MANAPIADQRRLLLIQELDTKIRQERHRQATLPVIAQISELEGRQNDLYDERVVRSSAAKDLQRELDKAEDDVAAVRARAERDNARLQSAGVSPKELQALQLGLEVLTRRQGELEDAEIEIMQRLEDAQRLAADAEQQYQAIAEQLIGLEKERIEALAASDRALEELTGDRHKLTLGLDADLLSRYERLLVTHGGIAAAPLIAGACQGCRLKLNAGDLGAIEAAPLDQIVTCEECGRILVRQA